MIDDSTNIPEQFQAECPCCGVIVHRNNDLQLFGFAHCWGCYHDIRDFWRNYARIKKGQQKGP